MRALRHFLTGLVLVLVALVVWGVGIEPRLLLDDEKYEAALPDLPVAWDGQRVVLLADFQVGMWLGNEGMVAEAVEDAVAARPALALFAGDFVYHPDSARVRRAVALMRPFVAAGIPTVAVLGNHDYAIFEHGDPMDMRIAAYLEQQLESAGVRVLENEALAVPAPGGGPPLWVVGVGPVWAGRSDPQAALAGLPAGTPRLAIMHNPESFRAFPAGTAPLALAGHTHGGQVRIPGFPRWSWLDIVKEGEVVADGWAADSIGAPGNQLYVNRGIGFSLVPVRINCRPELTTITLRQARGAPRVPDATTDG